MILQEKHYTTFIDSILPRANRVFLMLFIIVLVVFAHRLVPAEMTPEVTFEFAPPEWQTAISLPDDPCKSLVDHEGKLLYHYYPPGDVFNTVAGVIVSEDATRCGQELLSPRIPIVKTTARTKTLSISKESFSVAGTPGEPPKPNRSDIILVSVTNTGTKTETVQPAFVVRSAHTLLDTGVNTLYIKGHATVLSTHPVENIEIEEKRYSVARMRLKPMKLLAGETVRFSLLYRARTQMDNRPVLMETVVRERHNAEVFWQSVKLPYEIIHIPDPGIQALIDSSIRNIWQAREIKDGLPAFQVGLSCYRGLWVVDGAFLLETATMLGATEEARAGIHYILKQQQPSGAFEILTPEAYKENGIVLWMCLRHALLTQDKAWLRSIWPQLKKTVGYITRLRERSYEDPNWFCQGLIPPGTIDGGLWDGRKGEYTNVYWNLAGMKAAIQAAHWLGNEEQTRTWQREFDDFWSVFRDRASRDLRQDSFGNTYLPTLMNNLGEELPQRAQWSFCLSVYPGQVFKRGDPLAEGTMAMLEHTKREGLVCGTGWDPEGLWNGFASFYGHARLWMGDSGKAREALYAFANHASPLLAWREEQSPRDKPYRKVGDMPHNWASAEFIRLTVHLLALDRGNELHLFEGLPEVWVKPGMKTELRDVSTPFGPVSFQLTVSPEGDTAILDLAALTGTSCDNIILHLDHWTGINTGTTLTLQPGQAHVIRIPLSRQTNAD